MQATATPDVGQRAPDFTLKGPGGQPVSLADYRDRKHVVLVFFPLAFSPVCSHQLPLVQSELGELEDLDAAVLGVSVDSHHANSAYARQLGIQFPLLSDFDRKMSAAYGVLKIERGHSERAIFVIDKGGTVIHKEVSVAVNDPGHIPSTARVIEVLRAAS